MAADDTKNLGLGVLFTGNTTGILAELTKLEGRLKSFVSSLETMGTAGEKSAETLVKAQAKIADAAKEAAKAVGDVSKIITDGAVNAVKATDNLSTATGKSTEVFKSHGRSLADAREQLQGLSASTISQIQSSNMSMPVFDKLAQKMKTATSESVGYRKALVEGAMATENSSLKFNQYVSSLDKVEKTILQTKSSLGQLNANMTSKELDGWAKGVDRAQMVAASLNGELYKSGDVVMSATKSFMGLSKEQEFLATKYQNVISSQTAFGQSAGKIIESMASTTTGTKMAALQLDQLNKSWMGSVSETNNWTKAVEKVGTSSARTNGVIQVLNEDIAKGNISYKEATSVLNAHAQTMGKAGVQANGFSQFLSGLNSKLTGTASAAGMATTYFGTLGHAVGSLAAWIPAALIIGGLTEAVTGSIQAVLDYNQALKNLQAISGGTNAEIAVLGQEILHISDTTKFSAGEIAKGAVFIAQAGFTAAESISVIGAAAIGAMSTLEPLTTVADLLTTVIRSFKLEASDAADIMDKLAVAANDSKLNLEGMRTIFNYIGPVAKSVGASLEDTLGAIMALANVGMKMSTIGTGLRQVFTVLEGGSSKFGKAIRAAGLDSEAFNIKTQGLIKVLENLNIVIGGDFGKAQQLFGVRAGQAALVLSTMHEYVAILSKDTLEYGAAQIMAAKQSEALSVKLEMLSNQFRNMITRLSEGGATNYFGFLVDGASKLISVLGVLTNNAFAKLIIVLGLVYVSWVALAVAWSFLVSKMAVTTAITSVNAVIGITPGLFAAARIAIAATTAEMVTAGAATVGLGGAFTALKAIFMTIAVWAAANPWTTLIVATLALIAVFVSTRKSAEEQSATLQGNIVTYSQLGTSAKDLKDKLLELDNANKTGTVDAESYHNILAKIEKTMPEYGKAITNTIGANDNLSSSYKKQADIMGEAEKKYNAIVQAAAKQVVAINDAAVANLGYKTSAVQVDESNTNVALGFSRLWAMIVQGKSAAAIKIEEDHKMITLAKETAAATESMTEAEQKQALQLHNGQGDYDRIITSRVAGYNAQAKAMKDSANVQNIITRGMLEEMGQDWIDFYDKQSTANQLWIRNVAVQAGKAGAAARKALATADPEAAKDEAQLQAAALAAQQEVYKKALDDKMKFFDEEWKLQDRQNSEKLKLIQNETKIELAYLELENKEKIALARGYAKSEEEALQIETALQNDFADRNLKAITDGANKEIEETKRAFDAKKKQIEESTLLNSKLTEDYKKAGMAEAEHEQADSLVQTYEREIAEYTKFIADKTSALNKYTNASLAASKAIEQAQRNQAKTSIDVEKMRSDALKLTMTEDEKMSMDTQTQQTLMGAGYAALYAAQSAGSKEARDAMLASAKDYFSEAKGMINSLSVLGATSDGKQAIDAQSTQDLRLRLIGQYAGAEKAITELIIGNSTKEKAAADAAAAAAKIEIDERMNSVKTLMALMKEQMKISFDTSDALIQLQKIKDKIGEEYKVVIKIKGQASPEADLSVTIEEIKVLLTNLQTYMNGVVSQVVIKFFASSDGTATGLLIPAVLTSVKTLLTDFGTFIKSLVNNFIVQFMGNDGSSVDFINKIIGSTWTAIQTLSKDINALVTVHTITTKYVTSGSPSSSSTNAPTGSEIAPVEPFPSGSEMAEGGPVPGQGNGDSVSTMLTPGEFVVRKGVVNALGEGFFNLINGMKQYTTPKFNMKGITQAFAQGGMVQNNRAEVFTLNLQAGETKLPLKVMGNPQTMRQQIKAFEKELGKMRLSHA